jgi:hypothetical protein
LWLVLMLARSCCWPASTQIKQNSHPSCTKPLTCWCFLLFAAVRGCRILLLACQRTDQAELAFELYQIMKARGLQPRHNNAHSICFTLLKACYNRIRRGWRPGGYPPKAEPAGPYSSLGSSGLRPAEARQLLHVLEPAVAAAAATAAGAAAAGGAAAGARQGQQGQHARRYTFVDNAENINWPLLALSTYRWVLVLWLVGLVKLRAAECGWCFASVQAIV